MTDKCPPSIPIAPQYSYNPPSIPTAPQYSHILRLETTRSSGLFLLPTQTEQNKVVFVPGCA